MEYFSLTGKRISGIDSIFGEAGVCGGRYRNLLPRRRVSLFIHMRRSIMYCARGVTLSKNLTLCLAVSYSYFSSINKSYYKNNPEIFRFGVWPNCVIF